MKILHRKFTFRNYLRNFSTTTKKHYDFFVIGGGSGGLAAAKDAADLGKNVGVADFVLPTPHNTKWGLGGTCLNVGCIPKKLFHYAALKSEEFTQYQKMGYDITKPDTHCWEVLRSNIQMYIKKMNFMHRAKLREKKVTYYNKYASFIDNRTIRLSNPLKEEPDEIVSADKILISVGGRPDYGGYEGAEKHCITSDDIFSLKEAPGKTLVIGGSYVALESAGFLNGLGYDSTVMYRSILLRGFDQDIAERIQGHMSNHGVKFIAGSVPIAFKEGQTRKVRVEYKNSKGEISNEEFDTVLLAISRKALTGKLNLESAEVIYNTKNNKIIVDQEEKTNVDNIFSIGDCADGRPELTPPAIKAGRLLAHRLFNSSKKTLDYNFIPTTVFTPLEYSSIGYTEDQAKGQFGNDVKVFHSEFVPLEWNFNEDESKDVSYAKIIVNTKESNRVIGLHLLSPNSGEIMQGFATAIKCGVTKDQVDDTIGIHPTIAEDITNLKVDKEFGDGKKVEC